MTLSSNAKAKTPLALSRESLVRQYGGIGRRRRPKVRGRSKSLGPPDGRVIPATNALAPILAVQVASGSRATVPFGDHKCALPAPDCEQLPQFWLAPAHHSDICEPIH